MGTFTGQNLIDELVRRLRDVSQHAYGDAACVTFLNHVQYMVNARLGLVLGSATLTTGNSALYSIEDESILDLIRPVDVRDGNRVLTKVPWPQLVHGDAKWLRATASRAEEWSVIGREMLVVRPIPRVETALTVIYVKRPTPFDTDDLTIPWDLPDEYKPLVLDLTEAILLFSSREFTHLKAALDRAAQALGIDFIVQSLRRGDDKEHV